MAKLKQGFKLERTLKAWLASQGKAAISRIFNEEIRQLDINQLPLQEGLTQSSIALNNALSATILRAKSDGQVLILNTGLFYTGIIAGCNCADDPSPADEINEYCEADFYISIDSANAQVCLHHNDQ